MAESMAFFRIFSGLSDADRGRSFWVFGCLAHDYGGCTSTGFLFASEFFLFRIFYSISGYFHKVERYLCKYTVLSFNDNVLVEII